MKRIFIKPGETGTAIMPHSEVCEHMKVAGKEMPFKFLKCFSVQLLQENINKKGEMINFSSAISYAEAGIFRTIGENNEDVYYYYDGEEKVKMDRMILIRKIKLSLECEADYMSLIEIMKIVNPNLDITYNVATRRFEIVENVGKEIKQ